MSNAVQTASLTLQNTFTTPQKCFGLFNISISGTWGGTLTLQRSFDATTYLDVKTYTTNAEERGLEPEQDVYYRLGFKTGSSPTGTAVLRVSY